jgi:sulfur relay (sulfurtransferase) DsrC/TusE family protein
MKLDNFTENEIVDNVVKICSMYIDQLDYDCDQDGYFPSCKSIHEIIEKYVEKNFSNISDNDYKVIETVSEYQLEQNFSWPMPKDEALVELIRDSRKRLAK